jgi:hypothetical protein
MQNNGITIRLEERHLFQHHRPIEALRFFGEKVGSDVTEDE